MRILIFGAGALGGVLGALLSRAHDVRLIARGEHLQVIQEHGLRLEGLIEDNFKIPALESIEDQGLFDAIFVTTKSYDTDVAARCTVGHLSENGCIITLQNGIGNAETLSQYHRISSVVIGVTSMAAHRPRPGVIRYVSENEIILGSLIGKSSARDTAEKILRDAKIRVRTSENITGVIWSKAIVNAAINPLTAIYRCENGRIIEDKELYAQAVAICEEGMRVAAAKGIDLEPPDVIQYMSRIATNTAKNRSSMLSDIERGKRTEIDAICGAILRFGKELRIDCPVLSRVYYAVKSIERESVHK